MRRIMTAVVVVGPIIGEITRSYRQVRPWAAVTIFDLNPLFLALSLGFIKYCPAEVAPLNDRQ